MKKLIPLLLVLCLLLGCAAQPAPTTAATEPTTVATEPTTEPTTVPTTVAPTTEPQPQFRHPLTGMPLYEPLTVRPVAVVINNIWDAQPHHGTSKADVVYEILAEGGITRCLAIYTDLPAAGELGSIRSARTYFISLAKNYEGILVHCGDSVHANDLFRTGRYPHVEGGSVAIFYRNQQRLDAGYALEHTMFVKGDALQEFLNQHYSVEAKKDDYGFVFADDAQPIGEAANSVTVTYPLSGKTTRFDYDSEKNAYAVHQYKKDYVDGNTQEMVYFNNVIVMHARMRTIESGHVFHTLEGENTGYYISGGKITPIKWTRASENDSFHYTLEDGTPLTMTPGTSYIAIVPPNGSISYE